MKEMSEDEQEYFDKAFKHSHLGECYRAYLEAVIGGLCHWYGDKAYRQVTAWFDIITEGIGDLPE